MFLVKVFLFGHKDGKREREKKTFLMTLVGGVAPINENRKRLALPVFLLPSTDLPKMYVAHTTQSYTI